MDDFIGMLMLLVLLCMGAGVYFGLRKGVETFLTTPLTRDARLSMYFMGGACALASVAAQAMMLSAERPEFIVVVVFCASSAIWIWKTALQAD